MNFQSSLEKLDSQIIKYVAFDLFDTLISRHVHPEYVKKLWAKEMVNQLRLNVSFEIVYNLRVAFENELRQVSLSQGMDPEFNYKQLAKRIHEELSTNLSFVEFLEQMRNLEINTELRVQYLNKDCVELLQKCKEKGKKILCISDFYLPREYMEIILRYHCLIDYFDNFYFSCDYLLTKASGRLYSKLLNEEQIAPNSIIMIGDNLQSDYRKAKKNGIQPIWLDRIDKFKNYQKFWEEKNSYNSIIEGTALFDGLRTSANFEEVAFTLYYFIDCLYQNLLRNSVKDVFFLSREGEFLKKIFDEYRKQQGYVNEQCINSHYLIVSRKSTFIASLDELKNEKFELLFYKYKDQSLYSFLTSLNLPEQDIIEIGLYSPYDFNEIINDFKESQHFQWLLKNEYFNQCYEKTRIDQKLNLLRYLEQQNVNIHLEGLHIVDIGWIGTIQSNIFKTLRGMVPVTGYYIGLIYDSRIPENYNNKKHGILFEKDISRKMKETREGIIYGGMQIIFEILLMASHGSACGYVTNGEIVEALTKDDKKENELFIYTIKPVQEKMFKIFVKILHSFEKTIISYKHYKKDFLKIHTELILFPNLKEKEFFNSLYHLDTFGKIGFSTYKLTGEDK
jgi:predicted HAD superfamily hydrolase